VVYLKHCSKITYRSTPKRPSPRTQRLSILASKLALKCISNHGTILLRNWRHSNKHFSGLATQGGKTAVIMVRRNCVTVTLAYMQLKIHAPWYARTSKFRIVTSKDPKRVAMPTLNFLSFVSDYLILFFSTCSLTIYHLWHWITYNVLMCR